MKRFKSKKWKERIPLPFTTSTTAWPSRLAKSPFSYRGRSCTPEPTCRDAQCEFGISVARAAGYNFGARNAIEIFEQPVDMLWMPLVCARLCTIKSFDQAVEKLRVPLVTRMARGMRLKIVQPYLVPITWIATLAKSLTSGTRNTSKARTVHKLSIAHLAPISWQAALAPSDRIGCFNRISLANIDIGTYGIWLRSLLVIASFSRHSNITLKRLSTPYDWVHSQYHE